jgi:hypothetical protein
VNVDSLYLLKIELLQKRKSFAENDDIKDSKKRGKRDSAQKNDRKSTRKKARKAEMEKVEARKAKSK